MKNAEFIKAMNRTLSNELPKMQLSQKIGFYSAAALSMIRPVSAIADITRPAERERTWGDTAKDIAIALTDGADGKVARMTNATTELGGWMDQLVGDKIYMGLKEVDMARRGKISWLNAASRVVRDVAVTQARDVASKQGVDVKARIAGKVSTFYRMGTDILLDSPAAERMPKNIKRALVGSATMLLLYSGWQNMRDYRDKMN